MSDGNRLTAPLAIVGAGKLGETLLSAILAADLARPDQVRASARRATRLEALGAHGVTVTDDNRAAVEGAGVVIVAVKPHDMATALAQVREVLGQAIVISVAAGVRIADIEAAVGEGVPVIRAMPNTPARLRAGMTVLSAGTHATAEHLGVARRIFDAVGRTMELDERHIDAVTGLSASGPAFMYVVLEALAEGGVKAGLPRRVATELVAQAMFGAAKMVLETGEHPALLKDDVTTPAGCTIDGLLELEAGGLRVALIKAIVTAARRAGELG